MTEITGEKRLEVMSYGYRRKAKSKRQIMSNWSVKKKKKTEEKKYMPIGEVK